MTDAILMALSYLLFILLLKLLKKINEQIDGVLRLRKAI